MNLLQKLILLSEKHSYYCHDSNHYVSHVDKSSWGSRLEFDNWNIFKTEWEVDSKFDFDYNLLFRWDLQSITVSSLKSDYFNDESKQYYEDELQQFLDSNQIQTSIKEIEKMNDSDILQVNLKLYFVHQRKGAFRPIEIYNIQESDCSEILEFLTNAKNHLQSLWALD